MAAYAVDREFHEAMRQFRASARYSLDAERRDRVSVVRGPPPVSTIVPGHYSWPTRPRRR